MSSNQPQEQPKPQEQPEEIKCHLCKVGAHGVCPARLPATEKLPATPCCCGALS